MRHLYSTNAHSLRIVAVIAICFLATGIAVAEFVPYEARVTAARAQIRSGPGENFYPTDALPQGEIVEVYREDSRGWLAIRPPQDSFSWVFGQHVELQHDGFAEIVKDGAASRIGSRMSDHRNAAQVRLRKGEVVEVIGEDVIGGETWYKVAPPAGEFRWILATNVEQLGPLAETDSSTEAEPQTETATADDDATSSTDANVVQAVANEASAPTAPMVEVKSQGDNWRASPAGATQPPSYDVAAPPLAEVSETSPTPAKVASPVSLTNEPRSAIIPKPVPISSQATSQPGGLPDGLARELTEIELRLSRMVAAPTDQWNTERLERDIDQLLASAKSPAERDAVKVTAAKIDRFKSLGERHQQIAANAPLNGQPPITPLPSAAGIAATGGPIEASAALTSPSGAGKYDAVGILRPVVSKRAGAPQFALVDERGQVISFVTPTPDVNLQAYVGHRVGVVGNRGYIPEFHRAHVTAGRVTPLSERLIR